MAKKGKKPHPAESGNRPFVALAGLVQKAGIALHPEEKPVPKVAPPPPEVIERPPAPESEEEVFERAMMEVDRIRWHHDPSPSGIPSPRVPPDSEDQEDRLFLEAVEGDGVPPILEHPEYIEGWIGVAGRRFLPNLRNGAYSIQAYIDLHGFSREEARAAVEEFIVRMSKERSCCVKIVHGRGINSPTDKAVLKESLQRWLVTRRMSHHVLAYASAPYTDGGVGAIYVLLRKNP
jgi:DNA-nicking Smr family endonuclease